MRVVISILLNCMALFSLGQANPSKLKVNLDCRAGCDDNYIRTEIKFVDFVLDRQVADVHIMITSLVNGSGGRNVRFDFYGRNDFKNQVNTILFNQPPNATNAEIRIQFVKRIRLGLLPFMAKKPLQNTPIPTDVKPAETIKPDTIKTSINTDSTNLPNQETKDRWNYWVFKLGVDGNFNSDDNYKSYTATGYFSANRTTDKLRVNFAGYFNDYSNITEYELNGVIVKEKVKNQAYTFSHYLIKSMSSHWSIGYEMNYSNNSFSNNKSRKYFSSGIEYSIFPYKEVNNKFFAISYNVDVRDNRYYDTTIFDKMSEVLYGQKLQANLALNQKWGTVDLGVVYHTYLHDMKLDNLSASVSIDVRITAGLSFYISTYGNLVHDQVYLLKKDASLLDILTRRRQLASGYYVNTSAGITYRFGSVLNNFVNPRFSHNYR